MKIIATTRPSRAGSMRDILALVKRMDTVAIAEYPWRSLPEFQFFLKAVIDASVDATLPLNRVFAVLQHRLDTLATVETAIATKYPEAAQSMEPLVQAARDALLDKIKSVTKSMSKVAKTVITKPELDSFSLAVSKLGFPSPASSFSLATTNNGKTTACHYLEYKDLPTKDTTLGELWVVLVKEETEPGYFQTRVAVLHSFALPGMFPTMLVGKAIMLNVLQGVLFDAGIYLATSAMPTKTSSISKTLNLPATALSIRAGKLVVKLGDNEPKAIKAGTDFTKNLSKLLASARIAATVEHEVIPNRKAWEAVVDLSIPNLISAQSREILGSMGIDANAIELLQALGKKD